MAKYVNRDGLSHSFNSLPYVGKGPYYNAEQVKLRVDTFPAIDLVFCVSCKHRLPNGLCPFFQNFYPADTFYCALGETL